MRRDDIARYNSLQTRDRFTLLHSVRPDDFLDDNRPIHLPTPGQVASLTYEKLPAAYQMAVAGVNF